MNMIVFLLARLNIDFGAPGGEHNIESQDHNGRDLGDMRSLACIPTSLSFTCCLR
jgi:hypothetical protein